MNSNYLDPGRLLADDYFYIVVFQEVDGRMLALQNMSGNPRRQRFLRTKDEAQAWVSFYEKHFPEVKCHMVKIDASPTYEMMWPEGFEDRLDFAKKLNKYWSRKPLTSNSN
ncbi:baseplate wedge protein [Pseudomonas phage vB_PsaM_M1]|nr:baseplate wedge protein [Pseudomonas phage vB_PsaM_M1]